MIVGYHQGGTREIPLGEWNWNASAIVNARRHERHPLLRREAPGAARELAFDA
jgi:hypothetical protein